MAGKRTSAKKSTAKKAAAKKASPKKTAAKKAVAKKGAAKTAAAKPTSGPPRDADGEIDRGRVSVEHFTDLVGRPFTVTVGVVQVPMTLVAAQKSPYTPPPNAQRHPFSLIFESTAPDVLRGDGTYRLDGPDGLQLDQVLITPILRAMPNDGAVHYQICFG